MREQRFLLRALPTLIAAICPGAAFAAGFQLQNQNGAGTSNAFAGAAAVAEDASTIFFNPAGMTYLNPGHSVAGAATLLHRDLKFKDSGTNGVPLNLAGPTPPVPTFPLGSDGGQGGGVSLIPAAYYSVSLTQQLRLGIGLSAPFGNKTEWDDDFKGRFQGIFSEIKTINLNPSLAYQVTPAIAIGAGLNWQKFEADLRGAALQARPGGLPPIETRNKLKGDDTAWGWNIGALWQVSPSTRIGVAYRSKLDYEVEGDISTTVPGVGTFSTPVRADVELPDSASIAVFQKLSDRWDMMGDFTWTGWSSLPALTVRSDASGAVLTNENLDFKDSWRIGFGGQYHYNDALKLRFGVAYDKTPIPDADSRTVRLPDSDRWWLSFGGRYFFSPKTSLDVGYTHIFLPKENIDRRTFVGTNPTAQIVRGEFEASINILSFQLNHTF